jgi:small-conductance mechanosensitive channel
MRGDIQTRTQSPGRYICMYGKVLVIAGLALSAALLWVISRLYPGPYLFQASLTLIAVAVVYAVFQILLTNLIFKQIRDDKTRYTVSKVSSILFMVVFLIILVEIWVTETTSLIVSLGVIGAGVAIALQDVFKNFVGGFIIIGAKLYEVGDRIEIGGEAGDVIDIGVMSTTLLEMGAWVQGDQPTGRVTLIPNGRVITQPVHNYTKDHSFIWEELTIPITYGSDWERARDVILSIVRQETGEITKQAEKEIERLGEKYYFPRKVVEPSVYITPTDNWITFHVRYVTEAKGRRILRNRLYSLILKELQGIKGITISSATLTVTVMRPPEEKDREEAP